MNIREPMSAEEDNRQEAEGKAPFILCESSRSKHSKLFVIYFS